MSANKFRFVSPGVFLSEIDQSQLPRDPAAVGPAVIGRTQRGPGMRPVTVNSFLDFVEIFGNPIPGGEGGDVWRDGNRTSPTYASYAARAWLKNGSPLTVVRVLGETRRGAVEAGEAGWETSGSATASLASNGGAFGLFVCQNVNSSSSTNTLNLSANGGTAGNLITVDGLSSYAMSASVGAPAPLEFQLGTNTSGTAKNIADAFNGLAGFSTEFTAAASGSTEDPTAAATVTFTSVLEEASANTYSLTSTLVNAINTGSLFTGGADAGLGNNGTGSLAAIWYLNEGSIRLSGTNMANVATSSACEFIESNGANFRFKAIIEDKDGLNATTSSFSFNKNDDTYIRNVFNTDPTLMGTIVDDAEAQTYFLGETYERSLYDTLGTESAAASNAVAFIAAISNGNARRSSSAAAASGKIIGQSISPDTASYDPAAMVDLFSFKALDSGEWANSNIKISITDVSAPTNPEFNPYGSFTVEVRDARDTDSKKRVLESFTGCNLNPESADYIAVKIGDKYAEWDDDERRFTEYGDYANKSKYIYVEMESPKDPIYLPFGYRGPKTYLAASGTTNTGTGILGLVLDIPDGSPVNQVSGATGQAFHINGPATALRVSSSEGGFTDPSQAYFGLTTDQRTNTTFERSYIDLTRYMPPDALTEDTYVFSLDNIAYVSGSGGVENQAYYATDLHTTGAAISAGGPTPSAPAGGLSPSYERVLDAGFDSFTLPLVGGFDGFDVTDKDPIRNSKTSEASSTEYNNYAFNSVKRAIDTVADPEVVNINLAAVPGVTTPGLTTHLIDVCETRGDALAVIDLEDGYVPAADSNLPPNERVGSVTNTLSALKDRSINSSYACSYYPWVQTKDELGSGKILWVPPSVAALGTFASSDKKSAPWFAPAGFTRGGLSDGAAGIPVIGVREHLTRKMRDKLYENNVNPIAKFPAEGIVIFGQKTMQATPSALDRVNVRRMMLFVKKGISNIASTILFDNNTTATWNRFLARAEPFLANVQAQMGLTDYKIVLDSTTTTPDLIDRNIMYAKIFLKPARSIEFIAIDFVIQRTGASFDD